ncbi:response regulator [uncultured Flavobacterium sp.]|uniref:response regulator n=1 Tax=uncultured Flavobacterium sp. TaxID=165435 RepID=UPI0025FA9F0B|nr:response regulator [uncultured Flavobacterium sp.]
MTGSVACIMLIDDNKTDNFFHERVIRKNEASQTVVAMASAYEALAFLQSGKTLPDIIFLDVNMPGMGGYDFIAQYKALGLAKKCLIVIMTSDYADPEEEALEAAKGIFADFRPKPLTRESLGSVLEKYNTHP